MKFKHLTAVFIPMLMLAACSADDHIGVESPDNSVREPQSQGYMAVNLRMPTVNATRALNDEFDDGEDAEYSVHNGILVLFKNKKNKAGEMVEGDAEYCGAYDLGFPRNPETNPGGNVTTMYKRVVKIDDITIDEDEKIYGLVLLNYDNANISLTGSGLTINGHDCKVATSEGKTKADETDGEGTSGQTTAKGAKFSEIQGWTANISECKFADIPSLGATANSIFMTNAPLSDVRAEDFPLSDDKTPKIRTLVDLSDSFYVTEEEALANPAGVIYVERAVAKVTCSSFLDSNNTHKTGNEEYINTTLHVEVTKDGETFTAGLYYQVLEWGVANTENDSFVIHNYVDGKTELNWGLTSEKVSEELRDSYKRYRMVSNEPLSSYVKHDGEYNGIGSAIDQKKENLFRTYFCVDPHYSADKGQDIIVNGGDDQWKGKTIKWEKNSDHPQKFYPFENTFDVEHMTYGNTTRVGFWVKMVALKLKVDKDGNVVKDENGNDVVDDSAEPIKMTFYTRNGDNGDKAKLYYDLTNDEGDILNPLQQDVIADLSKNNDLLTKWQEAVKKALEGTSGSVSNYNIADFITVETAPNPSGTLEVTSIALNSKINIGGEEKDINFNYSFDTLINRFNSTYKYSEYKDGDTFYEVRIKHFGNDLTPWSSDKAVNDITGAYGEAGDERDNYYLGRYGLVRNNWYDIQVKSLKTLGLPRDPATWDVNWSNTPDDNESNHIAVHIAILSWAKRIQEVEF